MDIDCLSADELKKKCEWINMEGVACGSMCKRSYNLIPLVNLNIKRGCVFFVM